MPDWALWIEAGRVYGQAGATTAISLRGYGFGAAQRHPLRSSPDPQRTRVPGKPTRGGRGDL